MDIGLWRDISLVFLIPQAILVSLVPLALVGGAAYGVYRLRPLVKRFFARARAIMATAHMRAEQASATIVAPVTATYAVAARLGAWKRYVARELKL